MARAILALPLAYRAAFVMRHVNDLSIRHIAEILGKPEPRVVTPPPPVVRQQPKRKPKSKRTTKTGPA